MGNVLDHRDGLLVLTFVDEELGRLAELEDEEAHTKHGQGDAAQREQQVPPPHIVAPPATLGPWRQSGFVA